MMMMMMMIIMMTLGITKRDKILLLSLASFTEHNSTADDRSLVCAAIFKKIHKILVLSLLLTLIYLAVLSRINFSVSNQESYSSYFTIVTEAILLTTISLQVK